MRALPTLFLTASFFLLCRKGQPFRLRRDHTAVLLHQTAGRKHSTTLVENPTANMTAARLTEPRRGLRQHAAILSQNAASYMTTTCASGPTRVKHRGETSLREFILADGVQTAA